MQIKGDKYLLSLTLSGWASAGVADTCGLTERGTLGGTAGTVLTFKLGLPSDEKRADEGCSEKEGDLPDLADGGWESSTESTGWDERPAIGGRGFGGGGGGGSTGLGWDGRRRDAVRTDEGGGCSTTGLAAVGARRADGGCSATGLAAVGARRADSGCSKTG